MMTNFLAYSTAVPEDLMGQIMYGLGITAIGVIIVFSVLVLIMLVIYLFQGIFGQRSKPVKEEKKVSLPASTPAVAPAVAPASVKNEELVAAIAAATAMAQEELIVVLAAAVAAQEGCDPASSRYRIRSFRRIL